VLPAGLIAGSLVLSGVMAPTPLQPGDSPVNPPLAAIAPPLGEDSASTTGALSFTEPNRALQGLGHYPSASDSLAIPRISPSGTVRLTDATGLSASVFGAQAQVSSPVLPTLTMTLESVGRGQVSSKIQRTTMPEVDGLVAWQHHLVHNTSVAEYWRVDEGIEHGYVLENSPSGEGPVSIDLRFSGLTPRPLAHAVSLQDTSGVERVRWDRLLAWDATGTTLPATFAIRGATVSLEVDDRSAVYPIVIDPTFAQDAYLKASNAEAADYFGASVDISGDTLVVGAWGEDSADSTESDNTELQAGAAYVFVRSGSTWVQQAYLKASNAGADDRFGFSVAISGDTIVVGAPHEDSDAQSIDGDESDNSASNLGAAYVFVRDGTSWSQQAYVKADHPDACCPTEDRVGWAVDIDGDTIAVGAPEQTWSESLTDQGAVYIFHRVGTTWSQQGLVKGSTSDSDDEFGEAVSLSGDSLLVGASEEDSDSTGVGGSDNDDASEAGAAYVFTRSGSTWTEQAYLKASNTEADDLFGYAVALDGDVAVVGAHEEDSDGGDSAPDQSDNSLDGSGAAYVFERDGSTWTQTAFIKGPSPKNYKTFGISVDVVDDRVIAGAPAGTRGSVEVYTKSGSTWSHTQTLHASNVLDDQDQFGYSVALTGTTILGGAIDEESDLRGVFTTAKLTAQDNDDAGSSGAVYVFSTPDDTDNSSRSSDSSVASTPGIFLTLGSTPGHPINRAVLTWGAFQGFPGGAYSLVLTNSSDGGTTRVLGSGFLNRGGHLEKTIALPDLQPGSYVVTVTALSETGHALVLGNRFSVTPGGTLGAKTAESLQPLVR